MKAIFSLICFLLVCGCSSNKVHLYGRYLSDDDTQKITKSIEDAGFDVVTNTLSFPDSMEQSTLIYSPILNYDKSVDGLTAMLAQLGWPIANTELLVNGNHWFQNNSVGVFLLPEGVKQYDKIPTQDLVNDYDARHCDTAVTLKLNRDNTYQFVFTDNPTIKSDYLIGNWSMKSYPYLELASTDERWSLYFEIEQKVETDKVSQIEIIELKPLDKYHSITGCHFVYGQRV